MNTRPKFYNVLVCLCLMMAMVSCSSENNGNTSQVSKESQENTTTSREEDSELLQILATTTMLQDLCQIVGGEKVQVQGLIAPGIDPHLYEPTAKDSSYLENAQIIVYNGLHLEGKMLEIFSAMESRGKTVLSMESAIDQELLLFDQEDSSNPDPHIWFDPTLWMDATEYLGKEFASIDQHNAEYYLENASNYIIQLENLDEYIESRIAELPEEARILVTAHDAFQYFGNRYDVTLKSIQGVATNSEASTWDISHLADFIVEHQVKAVFVETSVSSKNIEALQEAVEAQGFLVSLGGELYSDSLGVGEHSTYIATYEANIDTIVEALS